MKWSISFSDLEVHGCLSTKQALLINILFFGLNIIVRILRYERNGNDASTLVYITCKINKR